MLVGSIRKGIRNISKKPYFKRDMFLLVVVIPAMLTLLFLLPSSIKNELTLYHGSPNAVSFYTTHFIHESFYHFSSNLVFYLMFIIPIYLLCQLADQRKKFYLMLASIFFVLPFLLSIVTLLVPASESLFSIPTSKSLGFSGIVSALFGFLPYSTLSYFKKSLGQKTGIFNLLMMAFFLLLGSALLTYPEPLTLSRISFLILVWGLLFGYSIRILRDASLKAYFSSVIDKISKNRIFRGGFLALYLLGLIAVFPEELRIGKDMVGVHIHLIGFAFGFLISYIFVREEFRQKKG